jgi:hypothetical protein
MTRAITSRRIAFLALWAVCLALVGVSLAALGIWCWTPRVPVFEDNLSLEAHIEQLTGPTALDCGTLGVFATAADMRAALACALNANRSGRWFRVTKYEQGIDSVIAHGLLSRPFGAVFSFSYDSSPSGGGGPDRFVAGRCGSPAVTIVHGEPMFTCAG